MCSQVEIQSLRQNSFRNFQEIVGQTSSDTLCKELIKQSKSFTLALFNNVSFLTQSDLKNLNLFLMILNFIVIFNLLFLQRTEIQNENTINIKYVQKQK